MKIIDTKRNSQNSFVTGKVYFDIKKIIFI